MAQASRTFQSVLLLSLALCFVSAHPAAYAEHATILERAAAVKPSYDYVIVGGGTSGLTVGDRLTEDGKYTVLVIENGILDNSSAILTGGGGAGMNPSRMYNINSEPQTQLNNRRFAVNIGKCVGGGSAVNGMVFQRGTSEEYDMWGELGGGTSTWNWKGILPYFKKGIYFTPPEQNFASQMNVTYDMNAWGQEKTTRIYATYSNMASGAMKFMYDAFKAFGIDIPKDGAAGTNGLFWFTTTMDPTATSRSYARTGHWDNLNRPNYELITGQKVNKILFSGTTATGVQFTPTNGGEVTTVSANKEVILAAGAIHTPQILQLSGVGPSALLQRANIPVLVDLPGVGYNFQDHSYIPAVSWQWGKQPPLPQVNVQPRGLLNPNLGVFLGLPVVSPDNYENIAQKFEEQDPAAYLPSGVDATVVAGYKAQQKVYARAMRSKGVTFFNTMVMGPGGTPQNLHPASRGTVLINPSNPQSEPIVDWRAMTNPIDMDITVEMIKFLRRFMTTGSLAQYQAREIAPGASYSTDAQIAQWLRGQVNPSVFHPIGTAAKMPRELGGVVSEDLLVHGTQKLSVVDASIMPTLVGGTITMTVYAIAEKAADIIRARG